MALAKKKNPGPSVGAAGTGKWEKLEGGGAGGTYFSMSSCGFSEWCTLKLTASLHLKMDGLNTFSFPFGARPIFRGELLESRNGFQHVLFLPQKRGKWSHLARICFKWVGPKLKKPRPYHPCNLHEWLDFFNGIYMSVNIYVPYQSHGSVMGKGVIKISPNLAQGFQTPHQGHLASWKDVMSCMSHRMGMYITGWWFQLLF